MTASAFVVHWNSPETCNELCAVLAAHEWVREIVVIDNASDLEQRGRLAEEPDRVRHLWLTQNLGWGKALNTALRPWLTTGADEFCLIAAHDASPEPRALDLLRLALAKDPALGAVCPEYGVDELPRFSRLRGPRSTSATRLATGTVAQVDYCHATVLLMRRACLEQVGLFDERMFAYGDELELCLRAKRAGWKMGLCWGSIVANPTTSTPSDLRVYLFTRNTLMIAREYSGTLCTALRAAWMPFKGALELLRSRAVGRARLLGWRDWILQRHGCPPAFLFGGDKGA